MAEKFRHQGEIAQAYLDTKAARHQMRRDDQDGKPFDPGTLAQRDRAATRADLLAMRDGKDPAGTSRKATPKRRK